MAGVCVIVAYRPKPGKEPELLKLVRDRVPTLLKEGLVTDRVPVIMRSEGRHDHRSVGMEIPRSGRRGAQESERARDVGEVLAVCDCIPLKTLAEAEEIFAGFEPIQIMSTKF